MGGEQWENRLFGGYFSGSSPRGRGTAQGAAWISQRGRFIPAWAGNRGCSPARHCLPAVHPRVGGEQEFHGVPAKLGGGSSPRGRGTVFAWANHPSGGRFIPAWAGNSAKHSPIGARLPVHPRVGGEQRANSPHTTYYTGSSPRGRGTGSMRLMSAFQVRFIPAWAGNRPNPADTSRDTPVHPRVGGEQPCACRESLSRLGSSPRGRGTVNSSFSKKSSLRFIPAWAGNRRCMATAFRQPTVHPRVGGEQAGCIRRRTFRNGSSPRGRGTARWRIPLP